MEVDGPLRDVSCPERAPSFRGMFSPELEARTGKAALNLGDVGSRRSADAGLSAAHHEVRGPGEVDQWLLTKGAACAHGPVVG